MKRLLVLCVASLLAGGCANVMVERGPARTQDAGRAGQQLDQARASAALGESEAALASLDLEADQVPDSLRARWHPLRADLLERTGDDFGAAAELAYLQPILPPDAAGANQRRIDALLSRLPDRTLSDAAATLPEGHPLYPSAARALTRRGLALPRALPPELQLAGGIEAGDWPTAEADGYRPPERVAVLLPLSGRLAPAGNAVRDGYLTAWYGERRRRPDVRFYDSEAAGALAAYQRAVAEGAQLVVGPLSQESVAQLFAGDLPVPLLALNRVQAPPPPGSASFSLAPEDEGVAAADRLLQRGLRRVVSVFGSDDNGRRSAAAFRERVAAEGGDVVAEIALAGPGPDYSEQLRMSGVGADFDAVFMALRAPEARLLVPQLTAVGMGGRPVMATSLVLSGGGNPQLDRELDGIEYPELPWMLRATPGLPTAETLSGRLPSARGNGARLFAFGADAWLLTAYLDHLGRSAERGVPGATGELRLDGFGNVVRDPAWAMFSGGRTRSALDGALIPQDVETLAPGQDARDDIPYE
ncbi:penicillin-binding protein activator [Coralloluteibacterium thermophilus]|uniref:Penicillin-binding protein activator n=1 Tax=Coralloluteibacterium thermophilum TaxID=2707049 RepID=A0ABV9NR22_9GAMM